MHIHTCSKCKWILAWVFVCLCVCVFCVYFLTYGNFVSSGLACCTFALMCRQFVGNSVQLLMIWGDSDEVSCDGEIEMQHFVCLCKVCFQWRHFFWGGGCLLTLNLSVGKLSETLFCSSCPKIFVQKCTIWCWKKANLGKFRGKIGILSAHNLLRQKFVVSIGKLHTRCSLTRARSLDFKYWCIALCIEKGG